jgi:hypothetical protein
MTVTLSVLLGLAAGLATGLAYFVALWRAAQGLAEGGGAARLAGGMLLRVTAVAGLVAGALAADAPPLAVMAGAAGFLAARIAATRLARPGQTREP